MFNVGDKVKVVYYTGSVQSALALVGHIGVVTRIGMYIDVVFSVNGNLITERYLEIELELYQDPIQTAVSPTQAANTIYFLGDYVAFKRQNDGLEIKCMVIGINYSSQYYDLRAIDTSAIVYSVPFNRVYADSQSAVTPQTSTKAAPTPTLTGLSAWLPTLGIWSTSLPDACPVIREYEGQQPVKCECGTHAVGGNKHSDWCPVQS